MKKFTKIALITALIMLITGGILTAGGILFGASPQAFLNGMERSAEKNDIFNRWFGMNWLDRLTGLDDLSLSCVGQQHLVGYAEIFTYGTAYSGYGDILAVDGYDLLDDFLSQLQCNLLLRQCRMGHQRGQCAFQLTHVVRNLGCYVIYDLVIQLDAFLETLGFKDGCPGFQIGRKQLGR